MKVKIWPALPAVLLAVLPAVLLAGAAAAETVGGLPLHVQRPHPRAVRVWVGDHISSTSTLAVATSAGILVIDTTGDPDVDAELRRIIARELGRDDFAVLINTHEHGDHTGGNCVYEDCQIIGHELVAAGMEAAASRIQESIPWRNQRIAELQGQIEALADGAEGKARLVEELTIARRNLEAVARAGKICPPTRTFADTETLQLGDTNVELYFIGGMHSASDIAVLLPDLGLLLTGDTMADVWLTDTPGCLASFAARSGVRHDFPRLLKNWDLLLARRGDIKTILPGHWNGELSFEGFAARVEYVRALWNGFNQGAAAGRGMQDLQTEFALRTRFPQLAESPGFRPQTHGMTTQEIWCEVTGQRSGAGEMYSILDAGGDEETVRALLADRQAARPKYFFVEAELNAQGYRLLQEEKIPQAVAMFRMNVELFPDSWNVYDSLGEALAKAGSTDEAVAMYEKSLQLNPESSSGRDALARIKAGGGS